MFMLHRDDQSPSQNPYINKIKINILHIDICNNFPLHTFNMHLVCAYLPSQSLRPSILTVDIRLDGVSKYGSYRVSLQLSFSLSLSLSLPSVYCLLSFFIKGREHGGRNVVVGHGRCSHQIM